eukprot:1157201-Pelagomonas_calceolata.AAC.11
MGPPEPSHAPPPAAAAAAAAPAANCMAPTKQAPPRECPIAMDNAPVAAAAAVGGPAPGWLFGDALRAFGFGGGVWGGWG